MKKVKAKIQSNVKVAKEFFKRDGGWKFFLPSTKWEWGTIIFVSFLFTYLKYAVGLDVFTLKGLGVFVLLLFIFIIFFAQGYDAGLRTMRKVFDDVLRDMATEVQKQKLLQKSKKVD
mgnify:CR=1 FL=1